ncbi:glycosyltransferase family 2 protein [Granulicoccus phenolivorans]|uniref:glycosyltransferase family 2 protein n=1 Tax=Granulicoccus phenolivorans TaxID=266854 RepID=UPI00138AE244|nr:glycosyltransferase family 2 protein [Granulicoccus phenolivorans]
MLAAARATKHQGLLATRDLGQLRQGIRARTDPKLRRERQLAVAGLHLPELPERSRQEGSVWAVTMVRNEADVIGDTVQHLLDQGVAGILVADNGSVDGTAQVIRGLNDARVYLVDDREPAFFQAAKLTELARRAAGAGADWIVPFDGDEFWFGLEGSLIDSLRSLASPIAVAHVHNAFPSPEGGGWRLDTSPARLQKVAFRWHRLAYLHHGNHAVFRPGRPTERLRVLHTPWRSFEQFERKIRLGAAAMDLARGRRTDSDTGGDHWRDLALLDDADLRTAWSDLLNGRAPEIMEWIPRGELRECHWRHARQWAEIWSQVSDEGATRK